MKISINEIKKLVLEAVSEVIDDLGALDEPENPDPLAGIDPTTGRVAPIRRIRPPRPAPPTATDSRTDRETLTLPLRRPRSTPTATSQNPKSDDDLKQLGTSIEAGWMTRDGHLTPAGVVEVRKRRNAFIDQFRQLNQDPDPTGTMMQNLNQHYNLDHLAYREAIEAYRRSMRLGRVGLRTGLANRPPMGSPGYVPAGNNTYPPVVSRGARAAAPGQMNENTLRKLIRKIVQEHFYKY